jgi:hypothetical protein
MKAIFLAGMLLIANDVVAMAQYLGNWGGRNPSNPYSVDNSQGAGNPFDPNSIRNPTGRYGSPYSSNSVTNPFATHAPLLYDQNGNYRGRLTANPNDPESISNPNSPYFSPSLPPDGQGLSVYADPEIERPPSRCCPPTSPYPGGQ